MRHLVACYGSLKKGFYNHRALGEDAEFLGVHTVHGVMYSNGSYPKLYRHAEFLKEFTADLEREHTIEVYRINENAFRRIDSMELGAGYEAELIDTPYGEATIYYMPHKHFYDGDHWVEAYSKKLTVKEE